MMLYPVAVPASTYAITVSVPMSSTNRYRYGRSGIIRFPTLPLVFTILAGDNVIAAINDAKGAYL